jgi:NTP pyrophosphatase (non-canonical NTP hydrolase)
MAGGGGTRGGHGRPRGTIRGPGRMAVEPAPEPLMTLREFQSLIREMYHDKDAARGVEGTFMWLTEEIGELATALRSGSHEEQALEFADVLAWLATIANVVEVDLEAAVRRKYGGGCPGCGELACTCPDAEKP